MHRTGWLYSSVAATQPSAYLSTRGHLGNLFTTLLLELGAITPNGMTKLSFSPATCLSNYCRSMFACNREGYSALLDRVDAKLSC